MNEPRPTLVRRLGKWRAGRDEVDHDVAVVMAARLAMSSARALAAVIAPIYLALVGFDAFRLGMLFLAVAVTSALMSSSIGLLSDRIGRRPFLVAMPLLAAAAGLVFALTTRTVPLVVAACLGTYGRGAGAGGGAVGPYQPAESALVTERVTAFRRNQAFGRLAFFSALGGLVGGLAAAVGAPATASPAHVLEAFRWVFVATAVLAAAAGLLALALEDEKHRGANRPPRTPVRFPRHSKALLMRLWATNGVNGVAIGMFGPFVTYWFFRRYGASPAELGWLFAAVNVASLASTLSASATARRLGIVRAIVWVRVVQGALLIPMVLMPSLWLAGGIYLVRMVVQRIGMPLRQSYAVGMADPDERSSVAALSNVPAQAAMAASPVLAGYLFNEVSLALPFELGGALQIVNAAMYWAFFRHMSPEEEHQEQRGSAADIPGTGSARGIGNGDGIGSGTAPAPSPSPGRYPEERGSAR